MKSFKFFDGENWIPVSGLELGTTSETAFPGDQGLIAYNHSQSAHAPSNANYYVHPSSHPASMITGLHACATSGVAGSVAWGNVSSKPSTFAPSSHTHAWSQVTSIPATASRWPAWSEVTGKPSTFAPSSHTHAASQVGLGSVQNYGIATQAQAQAGTANNVYMTPLRVAQAIASSGSSIKIAEGQYTGNGSLERNISVGFTPKFIFVGRAPFMAISKHAGDRVSIINNGFQIHVAQSTYAPNKDGDLYGWLAIG